MFSKRVNGKSQILSEMRLSCVTKQIVTTPERACVRTLAYCFNEYAVDMIAE